jgi:hypothetical protein
LLEPRRSAELQEKRVVEARGRALRERQDSSDPIQLKRSDASGAIINSVKEHLINERERGSVQTRQVPLRERQDSCDPIQVKRSHPPGVIACSMNEHFIDERKHLGPGELCHPANRSK